MKKPNYAWLIVDMECLKMELSVQNVMRNV